MIEKVAFIGLGNLGLPMAANVLKAGYLVVGYDIVPETMKRAVSEGIQAASNAFEATRDASIVITMVPSGKELRSLFLDENIASAARTGALFIDCSTIDLESSAQCKSWAQESGHMMVDAPVSGGAPRAAAGKLTVMVGGTEEAFARAEPVIASMSNNVIHVGPDGAGIAAKLCNNMIAGATLAAVGEAYALAQRLGVDDQKFFDVVSRSSGQCWAITEMCPVPGPVPSSPANNDFKPGGAANMLLKDLGMAQKEAVRLGSSIPMASTAYGMYSLFCNSGRGNEDVSAIIKLFQHQTT